MNCIKLASWVSQWSLRLISDLSGNMLKMKYFKKLASSHLEQCSWLPHFCPWHHLPPCVPCISLMIPGSLPGLWVTDRGHHLLCFEAQKLPDCLLNCFLMLKLGMAFFSLFLFCVHPTKLVVCPTGAYWFSPTSGLLFFPEKLSKFFQAAGSLGCHFDSSQLNMTGRAAWLFVS